MGQEGFMSRNACTFDDHLLSRRALLHGAIAGGALFGGFGRLFAEDHAAAALQADQRVILVFMSGGPSQFETWDPKPGAPTGGPHISIPTSISGVQFDEYLPHLARLANRMITVRSMTSANGDHDQGGFIAQTGYNPSSIVAPAPHWLSVCAHERPSSDRGRPCYVMLGADNFGKLHLPGPGSSVRAIKVSLARVMERAPKTCPQGRPRKPPITSVAKGCARPSASILPQAATQR